MPIDDEFGEYIPPARQYLDNLVVQHPELGQCELWQAIAWDTAKLRNHMARADSAADIDEAAGAGKPPPLVADAVVKQAETDVARRIMDLIDALNQRMAALEQRADSEERRAQPTRPWRWPRTSQRTRRKRCCRHWPTEPGGCTDERCLLAE